MRTSATIALLLFAPLGAASAADTELEAVVRKYLALPTISEREEMAPELAPFDATPVEALTKALWSVIPQPSGPGPIPWIAVGGGVALVVAGVVLMTLDGNCSSSSADGTCRDRTSLKWPAAAAIGGGALLFGAGSATILFAPSRDPRDPRGRVVGASAAARWTF